MLCFFLSYSQTLTPSPQTVENNGIVTLTGSGEFASMHFGTISYQPNFTSTSSPAAGYGLYLDLTDLTYTQAYSQTSSSPSKFTFKISNSIDQPITVTLYFKCTIINDLQGTSNSFQKSVTITVKPTTPAQTTVYNVAKSGSFTKNNCGPGKIGSIVTYTVAAGTYSASSQSAADQLAINAVNANGQAYANANGQCNTAYYNAQLSTSYTRNCGTGYAGSIVTYTVAAGTYSASSQSAADQLALNDANANGQNFANNNGTCTEVGKRYRVTLRPNGACDTSGEVSSFIWLREDFDLNNNNGYIPAYLSSTGDTRAGDGDYKFLYVINSSINESGVRIFQVLSGAVLGYTLCSQ